MGSFETKKGLKAFFVYKKMISNKKTSQRLSFLIHLWWAVRDSNPRPTD